jgi:copper(I)-binding protein
VIRASSGMTATGRLLLGAGVLAVAAMATAGCEAGADAPTLQFHSANSGANATVNGLQISDVFILGAPSGSAIAKGSSAGLFLSIYNGGDNADTLTGVTAAGTAASASLAAGSYPLQPEAAPTNLTGPTPEIVLTNLAQPLASGSYVTVTLQFQKAGDVTLNVPVEAQSYYYSTYSAPSSSSPSARPTSTVLPTVSVTPSGSGEPSGSAANPSATPSSQ